MQDKQSGDWSSARQVVRGLVSFKTSSHEAGLVQDKQSGLVSCKTNSQIAGHGRDKQSG